MIHAQKADRKGNVLLWGILGVQKEAVLSSKRAIVTVEERVSTLDAPPNACILPHWVVTAFAKCPRGPPLLTRTDITSATTCSIAPGTEYSRDREKFNAWVKQHILGTQNFEGYLALQRDPQVQAAYQ